MLKEPVRLSTEQLSMKIQMQRSSEVCCIYFNFSNLILSIRIISWDDSKGLGFPLAFMSITPGYFQKTKGKFIEPKELLAVQIPAYYQLHKPGNSGEILVTALILISNNGLSILLDNKPLLIVN